MCNYKIAFLKQTHECVYLVRHGHFRWRDEDGDDTIRSAIAENPMLHTNFTALSSTEPALLPIEVLHCGNRDFRAFCAPVSFVTLTLTRWPSYANMTCIPSRCICRPKMNFVLQSFQKLSYYIQTDIHTCSHRKYYHSALRVIKASCCWSRKYYLGRLYQLRCWAWIISF